MLNGTKPHTAVVDDIELNHPDSQVKLPEGFTLKEPQPVGRKDIEPTPPPKLDVRRCEKNEKTHRHLPANLVDELGLNSGCRFCGSPIHRAHAKSSWWMLIVADPRKKPSKKMLRAGRKMMRKAFARKDTVGSTRRDSKREAHAYVQKRLGREVSWKTARKQLAKWARQERGVTRGR